ncbi:hypothetical protein C0J52_13477 [Blattella germanica]|nr:hypothetical protein C0J52_13477 [Blattella germanica]
MPILPTLLTYVNNNVEILGAAHPPSKDSSKVDPNDGLPNHVCRQCVNQVNVSYNFKRQCELSDAAFRDYLKNDKSDLLLPVKHNESQSLSRPDINAENWAYLNVKAELSECHSDENMDQM